MNDYIQKFDSLIEGAKNELDEDEFEDLLDYIEDQIGLALYP